MAPNHNHSKNHISGPSHALSTEGYKKKEKIFLWSFILITTFMCIEAAGGFFTNSLALLADAGHMLTDASALLIALLAFAYSKKERSQHKTFGYQRLQVIAALINGLMLLAIGSAIILTAIKRFFNPVEIKGGIMLAIALAGLFVNLIVLLLIHKSSHNDTHKNLNVMGAMFHVIADILGSVAAIAAGTIIVLTGWHLADPILSIIVATMVLFSAYYLLREVFHVLLQGTPPHINIKTLHDELEALHPDIKDIHHIHAWMITAEEPVISFHVCIEPTASPDQLLPIIKSYLKKQYNIHESTIQTETTSSCPDDPSECPL